MMVDFCPKCGNFLLPKNNILKCSACDYYRDLNKFHVDNLKIIPLKKCISNENKKDFLKSVLKENKQFDESEIIKNSDKIIDIANNKFIENEKPHISNKFNQELKSYKKCLDDSDIEFLRNKYNTVCYNFFDELNFENLIVNSNKELIKDISKDFNEFLDSCEDYIHDSEIELIKTKYNNICSNIFDKLKIKEKIDKFNKKYCDTYKNKIKEKLPNKYISNSDKIEFSNLNDLKCDLTKIINEYNEEYIENQIKDNINIFNNLLNKNLSDDLIQAILTDEDNTKIIVNEQSKTFIQAKIKYLIEENGVSPKDILYISSHADNQNINEKYSIKKHTFNSFSCELLGIDNSYKEINDDELDVIIRSFFEKKITKSLESMGDVVKFFLYFYHITFANELNTEFQTIKSILNNFDEQYEKHYSEYFQLNNIKEKKEYVYSIIELIIANYLYIHNISYKFSVNPLLKSKDVMFNYIEHDENCVHELYFLNSKYLTNDINPEYICEKSRCYSNFYLPEYDIYIDLLNLNKYFQNNFTDLNSKNSYFEEIIKFNKEFKTKIVTIDENDDVTSILNNLQEKLIKFDVNIGEVNYSKLYESIILNNKLPEYDFFIETMKQFIKSFKSNVIYLDDNKNDISDLSIQKYLKENNEIFSKSLNLRNKFFLNVFKQIYDEYNFKLNKENSSDNNDIINYANIKLKKEAKIHNYKYILVDEYQNISYNKLNLLKQIQNKTNAKIIAIGNDLQPSCAYPSSDVNLFVNFDEYFENSKTLKILDDSNQTNNLFINFIENNKKQFISDENEFDLQIKLIGCMSIAENVLNLMNVLQRIYEKDNNAEILIIGRNTEDINEILCKDFLEAYREENSIKIVYNELPNLNIEYKTIHEPKDSKRDYVIILNLSDELTGFPNKIENDLVLDFITNRNNSMSFPEERRLFYFALTRAKKEVYLFFNEINPSIFIEEIKDYPCVERLNFGFSNKNIHEIYFKLNKEVDIIKTNNICPNCNSGYINLIIDNINTSFKLKCSEFCGWNVEELRFKNCSNICKADMDKLGINQFYTYFLHKYVKRDWRNGIYRGNSDDVEVSEKIIDYKYKNKNYAIQLFTEELMNAINYLSYYKMDNDVNKIALMVVPSGDEYEESDKYKNFEGYRLARSVNLIYQWYENGITKKIFGFNKEIIDLKHSFIRIEYVGPSRDNRDKPILHAQSIKFAGIPKSKDDIAFIILDDITTSGSSMIGCKQVLLNEGINEDKIFTLTIGATVKNRSGEI